MTESTWTHKFKSNVSITKNKLADILTNGNIMNISRFSCGDVSPFNGFQAMSKRLIQKGKQGGEDERTVAKSRNRVSKTLNRSPTAPRTSPSQSLVNLAANCSTLDSLSTGKLVSMDSQKNNERIRFSSVAHRHWPEHGHGRKPVARSKNVAVGPILFHHILAILPGSCT